MSDWKYKLDLKDLIKKYEDGKLSVPDLAKRVATRIRNMPCYESEKAILEKIASRFEKVRGVNQFDNVINVLYDWGDRELPTLPGRMQRKMCWIATVM